MLSPIFATTGLVFFSGCMIYAALEDARCYTIRNWLVLTIAGAALVLSPLAGLELAQIGMALATGALVLVVTFTLFAFRLIGGGDAKLAAAAALWLGPQGTLLFFIYAMLIGGVVAMAIIVLRRAPLPATAYGWPWMARLQQPGAGIPYAVAMAPGALLALPQTPWFALLA
jgi:prepilin peptidase CpaA